MNIGAQRSKATFKSNTPVAADGGGTVDSYTDLLTTYGNLRKKSGARRLEGGELVLTSTLVFECRWNADLETVKKYDIAVIDSRTFTIDSIEKIDEKNFYMRFELNEAQ